MAVWVLDAGHGGNDPGIVGNVLKRKESDIVLEAVLEVKKHLERNGEKVILTRDSDTTLSLEKRNEIANSSNCTFFVSFHMNYHTDRNVTGIEVFYGKDNEENERLAKSIRDEMLSEMKVKDKGVKKDKSGKMDKISAMSILINGEFLSNDEVEEQFNSKEFGMVVAKSCLAIVNKVLILTPVTEPKKMQKMAWRLCIEYYKDYNEAIDAMVDMHKKGFKRTHVVPYNGK